MDFLASLLAHLTAAGKPCFRLRLITMESIIDPNFSHSSSAPSLLLLLQLSLNAASRPPTKPVRCFWSLRRLRLQSFIRSSAAGRPLHLLAERRSRLDCRRERRRSERFRRSAWKLSSGWQSLMLMKPLSLLEKLHKIRCSPAVRPKGIKMRSRAARKAAKPASQPGSESHWLANLGRPIS